jgi:pimeloyl-ACP methyl ester carboxylesterase
MAGDLRELLDGQAITRTSLLGHSMGGKTAMQFAALYPEYLERLVVADIAPRAYPRGHDPILDALAVINPGGALTRAEVESQLASYVPNPVVRQFLLTNLQRDATGRFRWKINVPAIRENYDTIIGPVEIPAPVHIPSLFIRGGRSSHITDDDIASIHRMFPLSVVTTIPRAGHWVHADAPEEFRQTVQTFLEG